MLKLKYIAFSYLIINIIFLLFLFLISFIPISLQLILIRYLNPFFNWGMNNYEIIIFSLISFVIFLLFHIAITTIIRILLRQIRDTAN